MNTVELNRIFVPLHGNYPNYVHFADHIEDREMLLSELSIAKVDKKYLKALLKMWDNLNSATDSPKPTQVRSNITGRPITISVKTVIEYMWPEDAMNGISNTLNERFRKQREWLLNIHKAMPYKDYNKANLQFESDIPYLKFTCLDYNEQIAKVAFLKLTGKEPENITNNTNNTPSTCIHTTFQPPKSLQYFKELTHHLQSPLSHPNWEELESGKYYRDEIWHNRIYEDFRKEIGRLRTLVGKPGSGKTALALTFGYEWLKQGKPVFFLKSTNGDVVYKWKNDISDFLTKHTLLIIDDCHNNFEEVNK